MDAEQPSPILRTKLYRPPVAPDVVRRKRLLARLDEGRRRPLTLVSAPAGYGKSTLVSHWLTIRDESTTRTPAAPTTTATSAAQPNATPSRAATSAAPGSAGRASGWQSRASQQDQLRQLERDARARSEGSRRS